MANEITVRAGLLINKGNTRYPAAVPGGFTANMSAAGQVGPTPGGFMVPLAGMSVDLSKVLVPGGWCMIFNQDPATSTSFLCIGAFDPDTNEFYPINELLPGEFYPCRLSRFLGSEFGPHTGTAVTGRNVTLYLKPVGAPINARVDAFDA